METRGWNGMDKIAPFLFPPFPTFHSFHQTSSLPSPPIPPRFYLAKAGSRWVVENRVRAVGGGQAGRQLPRRERYSPEENTKGEGALETEGGLITIGLMVYPRWWPEVPVRAHTHTHTHTLAHSRELVRTSSSCSLLVLHYRHHPIVAYRGSTDY